MGLKKSAPLSQCLRQYHIESPQRNLRHLRDELSLDRGAGQGATPKYRENCKGECFQIEVLHYHIGFPSLGSCKSVLVSLFGTLDRFMTLGDSYHQQMFSRSAIFQIFSFQGGLKPLSFYPTSNHLQPQPQDALGPRRSPEPSGGSQGREARGRRGAALAPRDLPPSARRAAGAAEAQAAAAGAAAAAPGTWAEPGSSSGYPPVIWYITMENRIKSPFSMGKLAINGNFQ